MQPQSEIISKSKHKAKNRNNQQQLPDRTETTTTAAAKGAAAAATTLSKLSTPIRVIKSKRPLCHFKFYLDIRDHQLVKRIEEQIKALGGVLEFFLTDSVTHFITDKTDNNSCNNNIYNNNNNIIGSRPSTPQTPNTPQTPYSHESNGSTNGPTVATNTNSNKPIRQSRADAILNRARRQSNAATTTNISNTNIITPFTKQSTTDLIAQQLKNDVDDDNNKPSFLIWQTEQALRFFKKVQHELKAYLQQPRARKSSGKSSVFDPISLKGEFIKIESLKHNYRPYYQLFKQPPVTEWPRIELTREDGAFRLSPKKTPFLNAEKLEAIELREKKMTRKSRSRSSQLRQTALPASLQTQKKAAADIVAKQNITGQNINSLTTGDCKQQAAKETSDKQCGVCEICKIEYDTLTIHLKTKDHEYFAKNAQNFIALDSLIHATASVNKFLEENKTKIELKPEEELEEMEVEEELSIDVNVPDPLENPALETQPARFSTSEKPYEKRRQSGAHKTPSPSLREKSKRSTKGKHSSEKFQNTSKNSPVAAATQCNKSSPTKIASTKKKAKSSTAAAVVQKQETETATNAVCSVASTPSSRRKQSSSAAGFSPPIRAMLPPSSLYKVVETTELCTPPRKAQDIRGEHAVASPSLIVKFKKVRQTELHRLNGEAENFMFPKQRTSSEPTDMDRQTTSERAPVNISSSASIESTSEHNVDMDTEKTNEAATAEKPRLKMAGSKKAFAIAKRQLQPSKSAMVATTAKQSFQNAPIQPKVQLKNLRHHTTATVVALVAATATANHITLPEATRKSSRTATAIVSAATTSSRLLRAAVKAAKQKSLHRLATANENKLEANETTCSDTRKSCRMAVVKTEDRVGDYEEANTDKSDSDDECTNEEEEEEVEENDDDDEDEDEISDSDVQDYDDDLNDEDYVDRTIYYERSKIKKETRIKAESGISSTSREQRAARRIKIKTEVLSEEELESAEKPKTTAKGQKQTPTTKAKSTVKSKQKNLTKSAAIKKNQPVKRTFDHTKSERLSKLRYAFERLPVADVWYRVFSRQDKCEECYYEYFGSTKYRKLPYELGPIPFEKAKLTNDCCKLCSLNHNAKSTTTTLNDEPKNLEVKKELADLLVAANKTQTVVKSNRDTEELNGTASSTNSCIASAIQYTHKHKKLHLLQRYRQEQQELQQRLQEAPAEQLESKSVFRITSKSCDSKASTPERERAGSASSCASSSTTTLSKKLYHNKHLHKAAALLNLELPPRKSPREHASTLALVSCIIKQRQDSQSKPNSETDEPSPNATTPIPVANKTDVINSAPIVHQEHTCTVDLPELPHNTRSAAATPVEELRFATEISENVKRLRRGQNKYDHSPPFVLNTNAIATPTAAVPPIKPTESPKAKRGRPPKSATNRLLTQQKLLSETLPLPEKRQRRQKYVTAIHKRKRHSLNAITTTSALPSIRKTGCKKGVVEFEVDASALKALDTCAQYTNIRKLEWTIDKYLETSCKDVDLDLDFCAAMPCEATEIVAQTIAAIPTKTKTAPAPRTTTNAPTFVNTPPPTDCFTSDFDLYDLIANATTQPNATNGGSDDDHTQDSMKRHCPNLYNAVALHNYFRRRKNLKSNRTGWPKVQKKKSSTRQQQFLNQKIRFLQDIGMANGGIAIGQPLVVEPLSKEQTRESTVITPPDSEIEENADNVKKSLVVADDEDEAGDSLPEEDVETNDGVSIDAEDEHEADGEEDDDEEEEEDEDEIVADADVEEEEEEDEEIIDDLEDEASKEPAAKRARLVTTLNTSPIKTNYALLTPNMGTATATSTPTVQFLKGLRRTPLLNGSLGSCISPSEKAGDNSDIFTVSSDGLDTDLDMSNSHTQHKSGCHDEPNELRGQHCRHHHHQHQHTTPKRKFDLSKYAKNNATATSSCAAEAATAAVKSMAISQFLKKEVRVTCRRLRAPFRRFRYRR